ncbi:hypothetical protein [Nocardiopsis composta]|uniref:Uncharacterized protein n=1 Tax=Nocardiopsis composta TaxID=157465 RepID=A0A7W8QQ96_9ACTN|nr:hypothetical protein [Nocardiopsis composta]MBB5434627.1 hypothetical protein [Nocardiopsis composta]
MPATADRRFSVPLVVLTAAMLVAGLALGLLVATPGAPLTTEHRPEQSAVVPHLAVTAVVLAAAAALTLGTRSLRWAWSPLSARAGRRIAAAFRHARGSFTGALRCAAFLPLAGLMLYLVLRMGMQVTAGLDPNFTADAWGGPTALGAFAAHGVDALLGIGVCGALAHLVLPDPEDAGAAPPPR